MAGEVLQPWGLRAKGTRTVKTHQQLVWLASFAGLFLALTLPASIYFRAGEINFDEARCYFPAIQQLRDNFPRVDLSRDSLSANPPGYTQLLAGLSLMSKQSIPWVRFWHNLVSLVGAIALLVVFTRFCRPSAFFLMLPVVLSPYYLKQACVLSTDNIALAFAGICIGLLLFRSRSLWACSIVGLLTVGAIYVRQIYAWLLAPIAITLLITRRDAEGRRIQGILILTVVLSLILLALLVISWRGLVPPRFQSAHAGTSLSGVAYGISILGIFTPFFFSRKALLAENWQRPFVWAVIFGALLFVVAPTTPSYEEGRWGGVLWSLAKLGPLIADRSVLFLPLLIFGCFSLSKIIQELFRADKNKALIWSAGFFAWLATSIPNHQVFHRYFEGPVLLFLGTASCVTLQNGKNWKIKICVLCATFLTLGVVANYFTDNGFTSGPILKFGGK